MYSSCPLVRSHTENPCELCQAKFQARQNPSLPLERFRYSKCKCFRPITDYPLRDDDYRASTCRACHERDSDTYRERKGEPVSKEGRARRFRQAQRVIERALRARIRGERLKGHWRKAREQWERGELIEGWVTRAEIKSFEEGVYRKGPYRQWVGYTDPREEGEGSTGVVESDTGTSGAWERESDGWEEVTREGEGSEGWEESLTDGGDGWGGFPGEGEEGRDGEKVTDREESWEGFTGKEESSTDPQAQYCSSCN